MNTKQTPFSNASNVINNGVWKDKTGKYVFESCQNLHKSLSLIIEKGEEAQSIKKRIDNANEPKIIESILSEI